MLMTHNKLQPMQCYHIFSNSMVVYLAKNHYDSYSPQMVPTMAYVANISEKIMRGETEMVTPC